MNPAIPVLNAEQAAEWDEIARTREHIPSRVLMETAGRAVASVLAQELGEALGNGVLVVAGHGNNGGDGWVVARALRAVGCRVWGVDTGRERSADCEANRALALASGVELLAPQQSWPSVGVVVDGLLGTGASGAPRSTIRELAERIDAGPSPVVAIDGPTGLDLSTGEAHGPVRADLTVTFGGARRGHLLGRSWCGRLVVVDIGFPTPEPGWPLLVHDRWAAATLPPFEAEMHKGRRGRVLVVGGDQGMAGAAIHAARAAFGAGSGLIKIAAHPASVQAAQEQLPDALTLQTNLGSRVEAPLIEALEWADAVVLGPGMGRGGDRAAFVGSLLERCDKPVVIDADALVTRVDALMSGGTERVFTPHPGEFRAMMPELGDKVNTDRFEAAEAGARWLMSAATTAPSSPRRARAAASARPVLLLKGVPTVIAQPGNPSRVVASGNPSLATGGSGDVLAGFIGAFLARGLPAFDAAALGAQVLGRAAELAAAARSVRASRPADVVASLPDLWRDWARPGRHAPPVLLALAQPALE